MEDEQIGAGLRWASIKGYDPTVHALHNIQCPGKGPLAALKWQSNSALNIRKYLPRLGLFPLREYPTPEMAHISLRSASLQPYAYTVKNGALLRAMQFWTAVGESPSKKAHQGMSGFRGNGAKVQVQISQF